MEWTDKGATLSSGTPNGGNGFLLNGTTSGRVGLEYDLKIDSGSVDAMLPYDVTFQLPSVNQLISGQNFRVGTAATFNGSSASFHTVSPTLQFGADLIF